MGVGAIGAGMPANVGKSYSTSMGTNTGTSMGMGMGMGMGLNLGRKNGFSSRSTTSASGASHTPSSSLSSLSSIHQDQYDQFDQYNANQYNQYDQYNQYEQHDQYNYNENYNYKPYGHGHGHEYDAFDDEFEQVVALGLDLSRLELTDPSSQRTPTEWRARDNIFTSPSAFNNPNHLHLDPWVQPISKSQPQKHLAYTTPNTNTNMNANANATAIANANTRAYASVAAMTRTGTVVADSHSPLPYAHHPKIAHNERNNVQPLKSPSSQPQQQAILPQQKQSLPSPQYAKVVQRNNSNNSPASLSVSIPVQVPSPVTPATTAGMIKTEGLVKPGQVSVSASGPNKKNPAGQHRATYSTSTDYSRHSDASVSSNSSMSNYNPNKASNKHSHSHSQSQSQHGENEDRDYKEKNHGQGQGKYKRQDKRLYSADPHLGPRPTDWMLSEDTRRTRAIRDARFAQIVSMGLAPGRTKAGWAQARRPGKRDRDAAKARLRAMEEEKESERLKALLEDGSHPTSTSTSTSTHDTNVNVNVNSVSGADVRQPLTA
jgi:hypothetical protein